MLDIRLIRENPEKLDSMLKARGVSAQSKEVLNIDVALREIIKEIEALREARNKHAKTMAKATAEVRKGLVATGTKIREAIEAKDHQRKKLQDCLDQKLLNLPNWLAEDVPHGLTEAHNALIREWGKKPAFNFTPHSHDVLGVRHGLEVEQAVLFAGSRFVLLKGMLARAERALAALMLDLHTKKFGYTEISPPYLVQEKALYGSGQLPKFHEDAFQTKDGRWLISTAEISLVNLAREKILDAEALPVKYVAYTPCFRSEAGAAGRDTRGLMRLHQFSKVELVALCLPEESAKLHEAMLSHAEAVLQLLGLHYRIVKLCGGDTGFTAQKTYDIEVWMPGQNAYREISSCSNCLDFQARRMQAAYRTREGRKTFLHTLNGSGLAVGRTLAALLENYQTKDGSILWPEPLKNYMI